MQCEIKNVKKWGAEGDGHEVGAFHRSLSVLAEVRVE
jgi:hypothetical protein